MNQAAETEAEEGVVFWLFGVGEVISICRRRGQVEVWGDTAKIGIWCARAGRCCGGEGGDSAED
jgi:hypothetical protein